MRLVRHTCVSWSARDLTKVSPVGGADFPSGSQSKGWERCRVLEGPASLLKRWKGLLAATPYPSCWLRRSCARFTPVAERDGAAGCRPGMIAGASQPSLSLGINPKRVSRGMPCYMHSTGASQQQAACYDITWHVAGLNQRFPEDGQLARKP
jgi:hypothetical protein